MNSPSEIVQNLISSRSNDTPAGIHITIISSSFIHWPERKSNGPHLKTAIEGAKNALREHYSKAELHDLEKAIEELYGKPEPSQSCRGFGIYVSPTVKQMVKFHFEVDDRVVIGDTFAIRELIKERLYSTPHLVLALARNKAQLFIDENDALTEIRDDRFPLESKETFEYTNATHSSSFMGRSTTKQFENEKEVVWEKRTRDLFRQADRHLYKYLSAVPDVILAGTEENLALFNQVTSNKKHLTGFFTGSYANSPISKWYHFVLALNKAKIERQKSEAVEVLREKIGHGLGIGGVRRVASAVESGNCATLLVEEDFGKSKSINTETDKVELIIRQSIDKGCKVIMLNNNTLKEFGHIALITRYRPA